MLTRRPPPLGFATTLPSSRSLRRAFISSHCDLERSRVLEIGALDAPTFPERRETAYLDWFSTDQLRAQIEGNARRRPDRLVEVSHVIKDKRFSASVHDRFDVVIANHVIEHIPDPITWFDEIAKVTAPDGRLLLAVPERNFTFDYLRPESTAVDLLRAHREDLEQPDLWQVLESIYYYRPVRAQDFWEEPDGVAAKLARKRATFDQAIETARRRVADGYADVHCHVFSHASFPALCETLAEAGLLAWRVEDTAAVQEGRNEFHVCLTKPPQS